jgi:putative ABC transport system permease protein
MALLQQTMGRLGFMIGDVRHIKYEMQQSFHRILMLLSTVALAAIAVASLGVTNTIMASVRSRQWQFGILRSIGVTRSQLLRLIVAEALLLGLVACVLGLGAGFLMSVDANALGRTIIGYGPPITVPWDIIAGGTGLILLVAVGASLWPAINAARSTPLELLQWGRAAA